ncbi:hypothetical protein E4P42_15645 [Mycobacterium sp. PS03-16]|uniref:hypothetical protein n=1 Tax=Mycobacterium sp. PS03-16 TaxID=2559611 RepID=UPI001073217D|nr:hypothetical protein [Mycobacterium sp. PS03-16]TFV57334.1 hypothetical protein E4P42_15645 [Mycobacterium sp. PS03-16]
MAWGDPPEDPGSDGVGAGGIPRVLGDNVGTTGPFPPGAGAEGIGGFSDFAQQPGFSSPEYINDQFPDTDRTPGGAIKRQSPACGNGSGPKGTDFEQTCP